ncbi:iron-containing redox enzyme family protein [Nocardioides sp.]|uniref:iron-containing redox enzyme family protein n=1 Tax=Nocardioides sp. TaxID=35761 RepID=UPI003569F9CE
MLTPRPRGTLTETLFRALRAPGDDLSGLVALRPDDDVDAQLALWVLYELHYRGFEDVADDLEWHPDLLRLRADLERDFEQRLRARCAHDVPEGPFAEAFFDLVVDHDGPSIAAHVQRHATAEQVLELLRMRSIYHLKEADPTAWVVPRLPVGPKAALMELQYDEYGAGNPHRLHAQLFSVGLEACGLRSDPGAYLDLAPLEVLEQNNAMSLLGLHRRLRGAALGHLAAFEATSSLPSRRMAQGLNRLGFPAELVAYYEEHVTADAVHDQLAVRQICGSLLRTEPDLVGDVFFGARVALDLEDRFAVRVLARWDREQQVAS